MLHKKIEKVPNSEIDQLQLINAERQVHMAHLPQWSGAKYLALWLNKGLREQTGPKTQMQEIKQIKQQCYLC